MLKVLVLVIWIAIAAASEVEEIATESAVYGEKVDSKIAYGVPAVRTQNLDYALLKIVFINQVQVCGGSLVAPQWVLTSATCVTDPVEGLASIITVSLGGNTLLRPTFSHERIVIHPDYDYKSYANDLALVRLPKPASIDGRRIALSVLSTNTTTDVFASRVLTFCGWGNTNNRPSPSTSGLRCTTLFGVKSSVCSSNTNIICTKWADRDNNVCPGDYGGPLYSNSTGTQTVVGIAVYAPDMRTGSPCLDGHATEHTQVAGFSSWITETIDA